MKHLIYLPLILLISACSPHSVSGVWTTDEKNSHGISRLLVGYDGKAEFVTTQPKTINWHCFWAATDKNKVNLQCAPSTNSDKQQNFSLTINDQGLAELSSNAKLITTLTLQDENPAKAFK